ncbi:MAG TPA: hypothetical protein VMW36_05975 [Patescibacteria group bacterium]|nr:hypothetical protein [Patescibacteria group bacterium]
MRYQNFVALSVIAVIFIAISLTAYYYPTWLGFLSIFVTDALWASVLITIVLVVINAVYVWQTRQTIKEMEKSRKTEFFPHIRVDLNWLASVFLVLRVTNFGKGPATNIRAEIIFLPSNEKKKWEQAIMSPNESIRIFLPEGKMEKACEKSEKIIVKGEYKDLFDQTFKIDETLNAKEFIEQAKQLGQLMERDLPRIVEDMKNNIADELYRIRCELSDIRRELEGVRAAPKARALKKP